jgi:hypothetical protein
MYMYMSAYEYIYIIRTYEYIYVIRTSRLGDRHRLNCSVSESSLSLSIISSPANRDSPFKGDSEWWWWCLLEKDFNEGVTKSDPTQNADQPKA